MKIHGYLRVSTDTQDFENQKVGVVEFARMKGWEIDSWVIDDGISGAKEPEDRLLGRLLKKIQPGDIIIASEISRLGRKLMMVMRILEYCMKRDVRVYTVKDNYELGDNITSKVLAFAFGLAAEIEREMISKRTKEALARKKAEGVVLGRKIGTLSKKKKLDDKEAKVRKMYADGASISYIARALRVHRLTVASLVKRLGIARQPSEKQKKANVSRHVKLKTLDYDAIVGLDNFFRDFNDGMSINAIAMKYDVCSSSLRSWIERKGAWQQVIDADVIRREKTLSKNEKERRGIIPTYGPNR